MKRHYLKIPPTLKSWYPGAPPDDWRRVVFDDATEQGTCLRMLPLLPNLMGVRASAYGDEFYFEVGADKTRPDALYVTRIARAGGNCLPRAVPIPIQAAFQPWPVGEAPVLDTVGYIFGLDEDNEFAAPIADDARATLSVAPAPLLLARLAGASQELRREWQPGTDPVPADSAEAFMAVLRRVWQRLRLGRYLSLTARQESLLRGMVRPSQLDAIERESLLSLFGFKGLNPLAADPTFDVASTLTELQAVPLPAEVRSVLWAAMLRGLSVLELRRELQTSSAALSSIANDPVRSPKWHTAVFPRLLEAARDANDAPLTAVLSATTENDGRRAVARLADWAAALSFSDDAASQSVSQTSESGDTAGEDAQVGEQNLGDEGRLVDEWVLRFRAVDVESLAQMVTDLSTGTEILRLDRDPLPPISAFTGLAAEVKRLTVLIGNLAAALPDVAALEADHRKAHEAYNKAQAAFGPGVEALISSRGLTPEQLIEMAELGTRRAEIASLPEWIWSSDDVQFDRPDPAERMSVARHLLDPVIRRNIRLALDYLARLDEPVASGWLTAPEPGRDVAEHLREWFEQVHEFLIRVPQDIRHGLRVQSPSDFAAAQEVAVHMSHLASVLTADVVAAIESDVRTIVTGVDRGRQLEAYCDAAAWIQTNLPGVPVSFDLLKSRIQVGKRTSSPREAHSSATRLEHNWTEKSGSKATVALSRPDHTKNYGLITVPLVLVADRPVQINVAIEWEVRDGLRSDWPAEWPESEPAGTIRIPVYAWKPQPDQQTYHYSFKAAFPVRVAAVERRPRLEVVATVRNADDRTIVVPSTKLFWENVELNPPRLAPVWRDETDPEYVRSHPIGPQKYADGLLTRLKSGSSIATIAPRRFGKSTLVEYLHEAGNAEGLCVLPPIHCTQHGGASGIDYDRLWAWVSDRMQDRLGSGIPRDLAGALPGEHAFDDARRAAKARNYSAIVLLFDEAQLLFPQKAGAQLGSDLKRLLQSHWSRCTPAMVPVQVGMIGLPSLPERAADLMGLLLPKSRAEMTEEELRPLISKMAPGLMTTKGARQRIAESAGNLLTLRVVLDRLADRANSEQRVWVNYDDVLAVQDSLQQDLRSGREPGVALYVRDILNGADSVDEWHPLPSYPTAVALADTRVPGTALSDSIAPAIERLNRWCQLYQSAEDTARRTYDEERVREHLAALRERGVLDDNGFASDLLDAWLSGVARRQAFDESFRAALFAGAHRRIDIKEGAAPIASGGQAEIRVLDGIAYRIGRLTGDADRARFEMQSEIFHGLKRIVSNREPGSNHIFDIIDVGLSTRDENEAVQMYRWVDGEDLTGHLTAFSADIVIDLGAKLARALRLLHRHNILHRDIHPRNIVVDTKSDPESFRPVLIDFGFARFVTGPANTRLAGEHLAPEVLRTTPQWSPAADVFSLAWTLTAVLSDAEKPGSALRKLLKSCQDPRPDARPSAEELITHLSALAESRELDERRLSARAAIQRAASADNNEPWFSPVLRDNYSKLVAIKMGFYRPGVEYGAAAEFLNQILEACRSVRHLPPLQAQCHQLDVMQTLMALRARLFHAKEAHRADTVALLSAFEALTPDRQKDVMLEMIERVAGACRLKHLPAVMKTVVPNFS